MQECDSSCFDDLARLLFCVNLRMVFPKQHDVQEVYANRIYDDSTDANWEDEVQILGAFAAYCEYNNREYEYM